MPVEIAINNTLQVNKPIEVQTDRVWVSGQLFLFDERMAIFEITYGKSADGSRVRQEIWITSGPPLINFITSQAPAGTRLNVLEDISSELIRLVQETPGLKQQLIDNGHLRITGGSLIHGINV